MRTLTQTGEVIHSIHDLDGNRIAEYSYDAGTGTSTLIREYIWMNGRAIGVVEGGQVFFVRTDHIGRPVFATNDLGVKVWEASYLPFGGVHTSTGGIDLRFPGQWFQSESGLHQNWMRDYDPTTGRYIQADPLGLIDGASVYGYALQNPGRYVDPRGEAIWVAPVVGGVIGAVIGYHQTGCWQGALLGGSVGFLAGASFNTLSSMGVSSMAAGGTTGFGASAAAQVLVNAVEDECGCKGTSRPLKQLVFSSEFWLNNTIGAFSGVVGGFAGGSSSSSLVQWAQGSTTRTIVSESAAGGAAYLSGNPVAAVSAIDSLTNPAQGFAE